MDFLPFFQVLDSKTMEPLTELQLRDEGMYRFITIEYVDMMTTVSKDGQKSVVKENYSKKVRTYRKSDFEKIGALDIWNEKNGRLSLNSFCPDDSSDLTLR